MITSFWKSCELPPLFTIEGYHKVNRYDLTAAFVYSAVGIETLSRHLEIVLFA